MTAVSDHVYLVFLLWLVGSQEDGEHQESQAPDIIPRTLQSLTKQVVTGRHYWSHLHELLCGYTWLRKGVQYNMVHPDMHNSCMHTRLTSSVHRNMRQCILLLSGHRCLAIKVDYK